MIKYLFTMIKKMKRFALVSMFCFSFICANAQQDGYRPIKIGTIDCDTCKFGRGGLSIGDLFINLGDSCMYVAIKPISKDTTLAGLVLNTDYLKWLSNISGTISGSGTLNFIPKFTTSSSLGNSSISDNGSLVSINSLADIKVATDEHFSFESGSGTVVLRGETDLGAEQDILIKGTTVGLSTNGLTGLEVQNNGDVIIDNGNVGIGTTNPDYALDIERTTGSAELQLQARDGSETNIYFGDNDDADVGRLIYNHSLDYMSFYTNTNEIIRIDNSGNVGIGTTAPSKKLEVSGNILADITFTTALSSLETATDYYVRGDSVKAYVDRNDHDPITLVGSGGYLTLSGQDLTKSLIDTLSTDINDANWKTYIANNSGSGDGTVTSVGIRDDVGFTISNSPITTSGDINLVMAFSEFPDITESTGIKFVVTDPVEKEIAIGDVDLSDFNNDAGFVDNVNDGTATNQLLSWDGVDTWTPTTNITLNSTLGALNMNVSSKSNYIQLNDNLNSVVNNTIYLGRTQGSAELQESLIIAKHNSNTIFQVDTLGNVTNSNSLYIGEKSAANSDVSAYGQLWVKDNTPNELWFTDDAGTDVQLGTGNETITLSGDISGSGTTAITTTIGNDKILESMLKSVNAPTDEYVLTYESTTGDFEWQAPTSSVNWTLDNDTLSTGNYILSVNESSPDADKGGLTLNQGSSDGYIFTNKSSDVSHPFTSLAEPNTYFQLGQALLEQGGFILRGFSEGSVGSSISGYSVTPDNTILTSSIGVLNLVANKSSGTTSTSLADDETILSIRNRTSTKFIFKGDGSMYTTGGLLSVNESSPDCTTGGITLNQGGNDSYIFTLKSSDVAHGMTSIAETDTYSYFQKRLGASGGVIFSGLTEGYIGVSIAAYGTLTDDTETISSQGAFELNAFKKSGTTKISYALDDNIAVFRNNNITRHIFKGGGDAYADGNWLTFSDKRTKENIIDIPYGLNELMQISPKKYKRFSAGFKNGKIEKQGNGKDEIGFMAQDLYDIIPEVVSKPENEDESLYGINYPGLIPVLVKAIQEQQVQIEQLQAEIQLLKNHKYPY
jgi:hypothetical protein